MGGTTHQALRSNSREGRQILQKVHAGDPVGKPSWIGKKERERLMATVEPFRRPVVANVRTHVTLFPNAG